MFLDGKPEAAMLDFEKFWESRFVRVRVEALGQVGR